MSREGSGAGFSSGSGSGSGVAGFRDFSMDELRRRMDSELFEYSLMREKLDRTGVHVQKLVDPPKKTASLSKPTAEPIGPVSSVYGGLAATNVKDLGIF